MRKSLFALTASALLLVTAACGNSNNEAGSSNTGEKPVQAKTIKFWQFMGTMDDSSDINIAPIIKEFEDSHPGIKVDVQQLAWDNGLDKITTAFGANEAPDVVELGNTWVTQFATQGALLDVTDRIADVKDQYIGWDSVSYDSKYYGVPWLLGTRSLFYNKELFEQAGLDPNNPPKTWDEMKSAAETITSKTKAKGFGIAAGEAETPWTEFSIFLWSNGGDFLNGDHTASALNDPAAVSAMEYYNELSKSSLVAQDAVIGQEFAAGNVGMFISGAWNLRSLPQNAPDLKWGVAEIPASASGSTATFGGGEILSISAKSKYPDEAYQLVQFMTSKANAMKITEIAKSVFPPYPGMESDPFFADKPELTVFAKQLANAKNPPSLKEWQQISEAVTMAVEQVVLNKTAPADAMKEASDKVNSLLKP
ncbi:sugar ABC transporter substrate-binding protein [Paenibacillus glycanilyticus]|uniref:ABC transporter substrate-binding protein n=1 Tax=Paenibacillus glycanilyticus TaxID=126569 RepID=A0ABQ6GEK6_9BACL|nr:sugar ABC transporter substrate-binding protein [Paenibacillus glycanilyticus]GLX67728.1 ABC transporter substrate-binding protein [Paenibacillus glycanilyticus]